MQEPEQGGMNQSLTDRGYPNVRKVPGIFVQSTSGNNSVQVGAEFGYQSIHTGDPETAGNNYNPNFTKYQAFNMGPILRFYPVDTDFLRFDIHGGFGYTLAGLNGKKDGQEDNLSNLGGSYLLYGMGLTFGWKNFFIGFDLGRRETAFRGESTSQRWTIERFESDGFYGGVSFVFTTREATNELATNGPIKRDSDSSPQPARSKSGKSPEKDKLEKAREAIGD